MVGLSDAIAVVEDVIRRGVDEGRELDAVFVLVGGSAMAAYGVRALSEDVDLFSRRVPFDVVDAVEAEGRARFGPSFKLDVTSTENLWGSILVRDLVEDARLLLRTIEAGGRRFEVRAIGLETLYLLKVAAGRRRDLDDVRLLAPKTDPDALVSRFNALVRWHGDRHAIAGFADAFVASLSECFGAPSSVIDTLDVPQAVRAQLWNARRGGS